MRSILRAVAIALTLAAVVGVAMYQQAPLKVAYVNSVTLMQIAPGAAHADSILQHQGLIWDAQFKAKQDTLQQKEIAFQKALPTLSSTQQDAERKKLEDYQAQVEALQKDLTQKSADLQKAVLGPIQEMVKKVLDDIRVEDGYAIIFDNEPNQPLIWVSIDKNLDITDRVAGRLKTLSAPKAAGDPTTPGVTGPSGITHTGGGRGGAGLR